MKRHSSSVSTFQEETESNNQIVNIEEDTNNNFMFADESVESSVVRKQTKQSLIKKRLFLRPMLNIVKDLWVREQSDLNVKFAHETFNQKNSSNGLSLESIKFAKAQ